MPDVSFLVGDRVSWVDGGGDGVIAEVSDKDREWAADYLGASHRHVPVQWVGRDTVQWVLAADLRARPAEPHRGDHDVR